MSMPELKYQVCVVLRRGSGLLSFRGSKLDGDRKHAGTTSRTSRISSGPSDYRPVVSNRCKPGDVQHQRRVQRARLSGFVLGRRRAFVDQHP